MAREHRFEYECVQCRLRESAEDALVSTCPRCGGEMLNVDPVRS